MATKWKFLMGSLVYLSYYLQIFESFMVVGGLTFKTIFCRIFWCKRVHYRHHIKKRNHVSEFTFSALFLDLEFITILFQSIITWNAVHMIQIPYSRQCRLYLNSKSLHYNVYMDIVNSIITGKQRVYLLNFISINKMLIKC